MILCHASPRNPEARFCQALGHSLSAEPGDGGPAQKCKDSQGCGYLGLGERSLKGDSYRDPLGSSICVYEYVIYIYIDRYGILMKGLRGCIERVLTMAHLSFGLYYGLVSVTMSFDGNDMNV